MAMGIPAKAGDGINPVKQPPRYCNHDEHARNPCSPTGGHESLSTGNGITNYSASARRATSSSSMACTWAAHINDFSR